MENKTTIELTEEEVKLFLKFRQYQDVWHRVFRIKDGSVELFIDSQGVISKVGFNQVEKVIHLTDVNTPNKMMKI